MQLAHGKHCLFFLKKTNQNSYYTECMFLLNAPIPDPYLEGQSLSFLLLLINLVLRVMVKIERDFSWGGREDTRKVCWVDWSKFCLSKENGVLDIKNMELFNFSLLGKWK